MGMSKELVDKLRVAFKKDADKREEYKSKYRDRLRGELVSISALSKDPVRNPWESLAFYYEYELMEKDAEIERLNAKLDDLYMETGGYVG